jgi:cilia- and flagella-associated protein 52
MPQIELDIDHFCGTNTIKNGACFHPNGSSYISSSGSNVVISDVIDPHIQIVLPKHDDMITSITLSSQGKYIASGQRGDNADVVVWEFESQAIVFVFEEHDYMVEDLSFSLDEKILATLGNVEDGKLIFWDLSNGAIISSCSKLPTGTKCVKSGGFVKDIKRKNTGDYLFATGGQEGLMLWYLDPYQGHLESIKIATDIKRAITSINFSDDGETLFAATSSGDLIVFSIRSLKLISLISLSSRTGLSSILSCPVNNQVIAGSMDGKIRLYDLNSQSVLGEIPLDGSIIGLSPSLDRIEVLALSGNGTIARCNMNSFQNIVISESHSNSVTAISFSRQRNDRFASSSVDGTIRVWDLAEYSVICTSTSIRNQERGTYPTCISYDAMIISGWSDGKINAYDPSDGRYLWHIDNAHVDGVTAIALSHNGRFVLSGGANGEVRLWDIRSRELITHLKEHTNKVTALQLFVDDTLAISCSKDRSILRWDLRSEVRFITFKLYVEIPHLNFFVETSSLPYSKNGRYQRDSDFHR